MNLPRYIEQYGHVSALADGLVKDVLTKEFPEFSNSRIKYIACGTDNVVYEVDEKWIIKFPRGEVCFEKSLS